MKKRNLRTQNIVQFLLLLIIIGCANLLGKFLFTRMDLTTEKRYTLSETSKQKLKDLKDIVYLKVYLSGELPSGFQKLSTASRDLLSEMKTVAGSNLEFDFIDPTALPDEQQRNELYNQLAKKGLQPTNISERNAEGTSQRIIFPGAILTYLAKEQPLLLLKDRIGAAPEEMLNNSVQNLEFEIINAITKISTQKPASIAFLEGQGELSKFQTADIYKSLSASYPVSYVKIENKLDALRDYTCLIIAKPDSAFNEKDKFIIDQFVMKGGKVLWMVNPMIASMDSLAKTNEFVSVPHQLNLDDMLFKYGVRINNELVMDLQSVPIPILTGYVGNRPQNSLLPWYFFPLVTPESKHPIVNNLNAIRFEFPGSLDVVGNGEVAKTVLLTSSVYSRSVGSPAVVNLEMLRKEPDERQFNQPRKPLAVLLEGNFKSNYANRIPTLIATDSALAFKEVSVPNRMIVVADGSVIRNDYKASTQMVYPLGLDRYTNQFFGNKNFIMNCVDYLCDNSGLMNLRSKEFKLRLLDKTYLNENLNLVKIANLLLPVVLVLLFAVVKLVSRKRRFSRSIKAEA